MKRMRTLRHALMVLTVMAAMAAILGGCGSGSKLAGDFDEDKVEQQAMDDITVAESGDYEGWKARFAAELQASLTEDIFASYLSVLEKNGDFTEFGKTALTGQEQDGKNYAVAIVMAKHENGDVKYTIAYDENMKLVSFTI